MGKRRKVPSYRMHQARGLAVVTLSGKDFYLGPYGTQVSRDEYDRVVAEWLANGRRLAETEETPSLNVGQVLVRFWEYALRRWGDGTEKLTPALYHLRRVVRLVRQLYSRTEAEEFGPRALKACRLKLIESGLVRKSVNSDVQAFRRIFRWAAAEELIAATVLRRLESVEPLRQGDPRTKEGKKVRPVPEEHIEAVLGRVSPTVRAMIEVHLLTGMRPGELVSMRGQDIDRSEQPWRYRPEHHKTERHGVERVIFLGPRAQAVLKPLLKVAGDGPVFSPERAEEARNARRRLSRKSPMTPSQSKRERNREREWRWRSRYDKDSYRRAIVRACEDAEIPKWTPNRLRHNAATRLRKEFGLDAARVVLGHTGADTTAIYAEMDREKAAKAMWEVG